jgi:hypothetical protein
VVVTDLESGAVVRPCRRRARRSVPGQTDLRNPLAPVLLLHIVVQLCGSRRRRRRPDVFHGLRLAGRGAGGRHRCAREDGSREEQRPVPRRTGTERRVQMRAAPRRALLHLLNLHRRWP